jgi:hypothetical protein
MYLEKASARSSEAGLAGWIASNDATLFTMVMVVAIAVFLHSKLNVGTRENRRLTQENTSLAASLESTASELDDVQELLDRTSTKLNLTQEERDQLSRQLTEKLDQIVRLNDKLEALLAEKGRLEARRQTLTEEKQALLEEKAALLAEQSSLSEDRSTLTKSNATLRERLDLISEQLAAKIAALEEVEKERDRLKSQADELVDIVARLKARLEQLDVDLAEAQKRAVASEDAADSRIADLEGRLAADDKKIEDYLAQLRRAAALLDSLRAENKELQSTLSKAEQEHQRQLIEEGRNNRELIGLKGRMERVAIVFDASGSMNSPGPGGIGNRWAEAQQMAAKWLAHLNVQQCVLIVFSTEVRTFPQDGSLADLRGEGGKAKRDGLLASLKSVSPGGWTNTHDALRRAYQYNVDAILLFTDGAPSKTNGLFDETLARQIYQLCREHPNIPINTIGLGNYFDKNMSTFLRTVANLTGGTFRGQ